jgi:threonine dehydrogenase-like Zn-dependent dehydrogenase
LTVQILKAHGCRVLGFDKKLSKVELAREFGLEGGGVVGVDDPTQIVRSQTGGRGADGVIITAHSKTNKPIIIAADMSREKGKVVVVGLVSLDLPRRAFFEKELELMVSRAYGAGAYDSDYEKKGKDYPATYVRWTQGRNLAAFVDLLDREVVFTSPLLTHRIPLQDAQEAYDLILGKRDEPYIGILLTYDAPRKKTATIALREPYMRENASPLNLGIIGTGRFARGILLPRSRQWLRVAVYQPNKLLRSTIVIRVRPTIGRS